MKKYFIFTIFMIFLLPLSAGAIEENTQNSQELVEDEIRLAIEEDVQQPSETAKVEEKDKKDEPKKAYIDYNYLGERTPLLKEYTHKKFEGGIIQSIEPSMAYRGLMDFNFVEDEDESTKYNNALLDLNVIGKFKAPIEFKSQFNFLSPGHKNYLTGFFKDQYVAFKYIPHHKIYVGHYRTPIGKEGSASSYTLPLFNRSQIAKNLGNARAMGVKVEGKYDLVNYNLNFSSSDRKFKEFFPGVEFSGWVDLKPLGKTDGRWGELEVGGGINAGRRHENYFVTGAAASYKYKKIGLFAEYAISDGSNGSSGFSDKKAQGCALTAAYSLTKKLQLVFRYDLFDSDRQKADKMITEYTAGINYLIKGSALKLMLDYIYRDRESGKNSNRILFGMQVVI